MYAVTLDQTTVTANGSSGDPNLNLFNQLLFSQKGLDLGRQHQVVLKNQYTTPDPSYVDVDYIVITSGDGNEKYVASILDRPYSLRVGKNRIQ